MLALASTFSIGLAGGSVCTWIYMARWRRLKNWDLNKKYTRSELDIMDRHEERRKAMVNDHAHEITRMDGRRRAEEERRIEAEARIDAVRREADAEIADAKRDAMKSRKHADRADAKCKNMSRRLRKLEKLQGKGV